MRLVVDASVRIGEVLRAAGRTRLGDARLELFLPEQEWGEVQHEMPRRIDAFAHHRGVPADEAVALQVACLDAIQANVSIILSAVTAPLEDEARARSLRDPRDWPLSRVRSRCRRASGPSTTTCWEPACPPGRRRP